MKSKKICYKLFTVPVVTTGSLQLPLDLQEMLFLYTIQYSEMLTKKLENDIYRTLFKSLPVKNIKFTKVQKQKGTKDCSLFAVA